MVGDGIGHDGSYGVDGANRGNRGAKVVIAGGLNTCDGRELMRVGPADILRVLILTARVVVLMISRG